DRIGVQAAADAAALALLGSSRGRRRRRRALQHLSRRAARRCPKDAALMEVRVPDIGDFKDVPIIAVLVKAGDRIEKEQPLVTLESDKATVDVPAPAAGTVSEVRVKVGDKVSEGSVLLMLETSEEANAPAGDKERAAAPEPQKPRDEPRAATAREESPAGAPREEPRRTPSRAEGGPF